MSLLDRLSGWLASEEKGRPPDEGTLQLAAAVLLFQVAAADHRLEAAELARLRQVLQRDWGLDEAVLDELVAAARHEAETAVSLHGQLDRLNRLGPEAKYRMIVGLWQVAFADGEIHHYEEHLIRRLADLLHVPHREFIRAKHAALGQE